MRFSERNRERVSSFPLPIAVFAVNIFITWRLLRSEYIRQLPSIEAAFISLARYIQQHWPGYDWFPLWYGGFPFARAYQPGLHYTVAALAAVSGWSAAAAYHFVTAVTYSLAGVAFYYLTKTLGANRRFAFGGALFFSVFSPSLLLISNIRADTGGLWHARRLQAMMQYGEGPNITGLMLGMFALALLYAALTKRKAGTAIAAAVAIAAVPATNWPATVALCLSIAASLLAFTWSDLRAALPRLAGIGAMAVCFVSPLALPSTVWSTFHNANVMADAPTAGPKRWVVLALLVISLALARILLMRLKTAYPLRFAVLYLMIVGCIVLSAAGLQINLVPQPMRFHVAMEIPMAITGVLLAELGVRRWHRLSIPLAVMTGLFCAFQTYHFRQHSRSMAQGLDIHGTLEYQEARWIDSNMRGLRVAVPGTVSFWMNAFTDTPQFAGCCEQSIVNPENFVASYVMGAGFQSDEQSADYSLLWLKAWAVQAVAIGGPDSREAYKAFQFPQRFRNRLPLLWSSGDDFIYRVPERASGLARVVRTADLVKHAPANGIDVTELRPFVGELDDSALPIASFVWRGPNDADIRGSLQPEDAFSVAINYEAGWSARAGTREVPLHSDGLGLIAIEPHCSGPCEIEMSWTPGFEPVAMRALALFGAIASALWFWRSR